MHNLFLLHSVLNKQEVQKANRCFLFFDVLVIKRKLFKIVYYNKMRFNFFYTNKAVIIHYKMINLGSITNEDNKEHNKNWPFIPDHQYGILIIQPFHAWHGMTFDFLEI